MSTRDAAEMAGIEYAKLNRIENESMSGSSGGGVTAPTLVKLAKAYGVSTDWLCGLTADPTPAAQLVRRPAKKKAAKKAARKVAKKA